MEKQYYLITGQQNNELNLLPEVQFKQINYLEEESTVLIGKEEVDNSVHKDIVLGYNPRIVSLTIDPSGSL